MGPCVLEQGPVGRSCGRGNEDSVSHKVRILLVSYANKNFSTRTMLRRVRKMFLGLFSMKERLK